METNKILMLVDKLKKQLKISDNYAINAKPKDEILPSVWELQNNHIRETITELEKYESETQKGCKYCGVGGWKTLFRIIENYPYAEIDRFLECEDCEYNYDEQNSIDESSPCHECDRQPFTMYNQLNLTIGVVGNKIMFKDKTNCCQKQFININFCPMCGRKLGLQNIC